MNAFGGLYERVLVRSCLCQHTRACVACVLPQAAVRSNPPQLAYVSIIQHT
jgi:hypothetical protein